MKKIILTIFLTATIMTALFCGAAGFAIGNYCVQFVLERSNFGEPPKAYALIMPPSLRQFKKPTAYSKTREILSEDGLHLIADCFYSDYETDKWVIVLHGYGCTRQNSWQIAEDYLRLGYNVLTPDLRASGMSEGHYITMGVKEARDVICWTKALAENYGDAKIVLHGVSMGAVTAMMAAKADDLPQNLTAVIADSGFTSAYDLLSIMLEESFNIPAYPVMPMVDYRCAKLAGFSLREAVPIEAVKYAKVPILFIQGDKDTLVPPYMADLLYRACNAPQKDVYIAKGAIHGVANQTNHDEYYARIESFLLPYME